MSQSKNLSNKLIKCGLLATSIAAVSGQAIASDDLKFNGFMSIGVGMMDTDDRTLDGKEEYSIAGYTDRFDMKNGSLFALQVSKQISDKVGVTGQLVAKGTKNFDMEASWAYATFSPTDVDSIRAGKLRAPFFFYSDFLEVGYAYSWVRPPVDVYARIPFSTFEGIDYTRQFEFGDATGSVQVYYGRFNDRIFISGGRSFELDLQDMAGVVLNTSWESWTFRASLHRSDLNSNDPFILGVAAQAKAGAKAGVLQQLQQNPNIPAAQREAIAEAKGNEIRDAFLLDNETTTFAELAVAYDDGANIGVFEYTQMDHDNSAFTDDSAWLATYGRRLDEVTLHITYSKQRDKAENGLIGTIQKASPTNIENTTSVIAGIRYDFAANTALKFEIENKKEENFKGKEVSGNLVSVSVDMVF